MKKMLLIAMAVVMMTGVMVGCSGKPSGLSDETYEIAKQMIAVADDYLDMNITPEEAKEKAKRLESRLDKSAESNNEKLMQTMVTGLKLTIDGAAYEAMKPLSNDTGEADNKVLKERNELADKINEKSR